MKAPTLEIYPDLGQGHRGIATDTQHDRPDDSYDRNRSTRYARQSCAVSCDPFRAHSRSSTPTARISLK